MKRTTEKDLDNQVTAINKLVGLPGAPYSTVGAYILDTIYGLFSLHQYTNRHGGTTDVFRVGHVSKRELHGLMDGFITGLRVKP